MSLWESFFKKVTAVVTGRTVLDEALFEELEEALLLADVGLPTALQLVERVRERTKKEKITTVAELPVFLKEEVATILKMGEHQLSLKKGELTPILLVGVNGVGKTTSLGKLGYWLKERGYQVLVAAADTFRAAAVEQLNVWCTQAGLALVHQQTGADPAAVVYDALQAAKSRQMDVLLIDTAGRLQTKRNLMEELKKIQRVIERENPGRKSEVLLVLEATTGQNALSQAALFSEAVGVNGVILTKTEGTAKGGVILGVQNEYHLPVKFIGTGEGITDFQEFDPETFSQTLI